MQLFAFTITFMLVSAYTSFLVFLLANKHPSA